MGEVAEGIAASCRGTGNNGLSSCEAQNVASIPQEDCGSAAGTVGEDEGEPEEGGVEPNSGEILGASDGLLLRRLSNFEQSPSSPSVIIFYWIGRCEGTMRLSRSLVPLMAQADRFLEPQAALPHCAISPFGTLGTVFTQQVK